MNLPIVNVFESSYEYWEEHKPTIEESMRLFQECGSYAIRPIKKRLIRTVSNAYEAAVHIALESADNALERHINEALDSNPDFATWRKSMPSQTPKPLTDYQRKHSHGDNVSQLIDEIDCILSEGQFLFHGGCWMGENILGSEYITSSPLSTSFCPQIALRNAVWKGKAYDAGVIDLLVLKVTNPQTKIFSYKIKGTDKGHEKEVLFSSGARLKLISSETIRYDYKVYKVIPNSTTRGEEKDVCINVKLVEIS